MVGEGADGGALDGAAEDVAVGRKSEPLVDPASASGTAVADAGDDVASWTGVEVGAAVQEVVTTAASTPSAVRQERQNTCLILHPKSVGRESNSVNVHAVVIPEEEAIARYSFGQTGIDATIENPPTGKSIFFTQRRAAAQYVATL